MGKTGIFRILFLITLFSMSLFGATVDQTPGVLETMVFYVHDPDMVDMYFLVFSAISRMMHSPEYFSLIKFMFFLGGFIVFVSGIFKSFGGGGSGEGAISGYIKYLIVGVALLTLVSYYGNTTILIKAKNLPDVCDTYGNDRSGVAIPDGFPTFIAYGFYFTNHMGVLLTELAESAYSTVYSDAQLGLSRNGGYMGALKGSIRMLTTNPNSLTLTEETNSTQPYDFSKISKALFTDCILVPFSAKGTYGEVELNNLMSNPSIPTYLDGLYSANSGRGREVSPGNFASDFSLKYQGEIYNCGEFYTGKVADALTKYAASSCGIAGVTKGSISLLTGASPTMSKFQDTAIQAGLITQLEESQSSLGIGVSGVGYASGKTKAEFIQTNLASGTYMAEMLPYLQVTIRAILYAFFPFVFVVILLPGGMKVLVNYSQSLIWIELWTPTAAILDLFMSSHAAKAYEQSMNSGGGMTLMNSVDMLSSGSTIAGVAGYLYMSVPALTWLILKGSAQMLQGITSATAAGMSTNIRTDSINKDTELVQKNKESNARSGKDLSMAEMQHYEAVQSGRVEGATLGTQMKAGMGVMAGMAASNEQEKVSSYQLTSKETGLSGSSLGKAKAVLNSVKTVTDIKAGQNISDGDSFSGLGKKFIKAKVNEQTGEQDASPTALSSNEVRKKTINTQAKDKGDITGVDAAGGPEALQDATAKDTAKKTKQTNSEFKNVAAAMKAGVTDADKNNWNRDEMSEMRKRLRANKVGAQDTGGQKGIDSLKTLTNQKERDAIAKQLGFHNKDGIVDDDARTRFNDAQERYGKQVAKIGKNGDLEVGLMGANNKWQVATITAKGVETNVGNVKVAGAVAMSNSIIKRETGKIQDIKRDKGDTDKEYDKKNSDHRSKEIERINTENSPSVVQKELDIMGQALKAKKEYTPGNAVLAEGMRRVTKNKEMLGDGVVNREVLQLVTDVYSDKTPDTDNKEVGPAKVAPAKKVTPAKTEKTVTGAPVAPIVAAKTETGAPVAPIVAVRPKATQGQTLKSAKKIKFKSTSDAYIDSLDANPNGLGPNIDVEKMRVETNKVIKNGNKAADKLLKTWE